MTVKRACKVSGIIEPLSCNDVELQMIKGTLPPASLAPEGFHNEENTEKSNEPRGRRDGGGDEDLDKCAQGVIIGDLNEETKVKGNSSCQEDGPTQVVVVTPVSSSNNSSTVESPGSKSTVVFIDEDKPLSNEEKNIHYKFPKNVMAGRKIRELMNANVRETIRLQMKQPSDPKRAFKICAVAGVAIAIQVIVLVLIFI